MLDDKDITVLLCEDEVLIAMTTTAILEDHGMKVLEATNAAAALDFLGSDEIDILVTDIGLPDMSGLELALQVRLARPELPVVFATGDLRVPGSEGMEKVAVLGKPYRDEDLVGEIRRLVKRE